MKDAILVINAGSSSIKFSIFSSTLKLMYHGEIEKIFESPILTILDATHSEIVKQEIQSAGYELSLSTFFDWLNQQADTIKLGSAGHRVVHGGAIFYHPTLITDNVISDMESLIPLAPLHQPYNIEAIKMIKKKFPNLKQVACFDTTFHQTQDKLATLFAIPKNLTDENIIRYGFHGISYEYISSVMSAYLGDQANTRVIVAHLGSGASMCAMYQKKSVATTMGFTALDGLMMGKRCGHIDPGVLLYLMQEKHYTASTIQDLLYNKSGLLGVSGISNDVRELTSSTDPLANEAIELFCYRAALEMGSLCAALNGCNAFIFTAGIGENSAIVRKKICDRLTWLGIKICNLANQNNQSIISDKNSLITVCVIPTNEELMIAKHTNQTQE